MLAQRKDSGLSTTQWEPLVKQFPGLTEEFWAMNLVWGQDTFASTRHTRAQSTLCVAASDEAKQPTQPTAPLPTSCPPMPVVLEYLEELCFWYVQEVLQVTKLHWCTLRTTASERVNCVLITAAVLVERVVQGQKCEGGEYAAHTSLVELIFRHLFLSCCSGC